MPVTEKSVRDALKNVKDPELGLDLVVLGLVYDIEVADSNVKAVISLTSPLCPVAGQIVEDARQAILAVEGVDNADASKDRTVTLYRGAGGLYSAYENVPLELKGPGVWYAELDGQNGDWRLWQRVVTPLVHLELKPQ